MRFISCPLASTIKTRPPKLLCAANTPRRGRDQRCSSSPLDASYDKNRFLKSRHRRPRSTLIVILGVLHMYESYSLRWYTWLGSVASPQKTISSSSLLFFHACDRTLNAITRPGIDRCCVEGGRRPVVKPTYGSQLALPCAGSIDSTSSPVHGKHRQKRSALRHTESHGVYTRESQE